MPHCICKPANIKFAIVAPSIMISHSCYKTGTRTFAIVSPSIIRPHCTCKTANINFAIVAPSIIRWHTLQNSYSQIGDSGPLHHKVTQHLQNNQANIGDSGNLHHSRKTIYSQIGDSGPLHHQVAQHIENWNTLAIMDPSIIRSHITYKTVSLKLFFNSGPSITHSTLDPPSSGHTAPTKHTVTNWR